MFITAVATVADKCWPSSEAKPLASKCQRFVIGRDEALLKSLAEAARLGETKWKPKMQRS